MHITYYANVKTTWCCTHDTQLEQLENAHVFSPGLFKRFLGGECDLLVFDAHEGFDPDALGALAGTLRGGGLMLLLTPSLDIWHTLTDREFQRINVYPYSNHQNNGLFLKRLAGLLDASDNVLHLQQGQPLPVCPMLKTISENKRYIELPFHSLDQKNAVEAIIKVVTGQRRRPVLIVSDRGRGKSTALGLAAASLLQKQQINIIVTAPARSAVDSLFHHCEQQLKAAGVTILTRSNTLQVEVPTTTIDGHHSILSFCSVDDMLTKQPKADMLMIDEAAAIPLSHLEALLGHYARIAFASTEHGYEGSGRGIALRFNDVLDNNTRGWKRMRLTTPIRWADGDSMEHFINSLLLLDTNPGISSLPTDKDTDACQIEWISQSELAMNETLLRQVFGMLVQAHYRTKPYDLRHLLDGPNLSVAIARQDNNIIATMLVADEGGFDVDTARGIWLGRIRPRGHLLAESLAFQLGIEQAVMLRCRRIVRLVVDPTKRRQGLGSRILRWLQDDCESRGIDYSGSSFAVSNDLLSFWHANEFTTVRLSLKRGKTSAAHSALLIKGLSTEGKKIHALASAHFAEQFPVLLGHDFRSLDVELAKALLRNSTIQRNDQLTDAQVENLCAFAFARRPYEMTIAAFNQLASTVLTCSDADLLDSFDIMLMIEKCLQGKLWHELNLQSRHHGREHAVDELRRIGTILLKHYYPLHVKRFQRKLDEYKTPTKNATP